MSATSETIPDTFVNGLEKFDTLYFNNLIRALGNKKSISRTNPLDSGITEEFHRLGYGSPDTGYMLRQYNKDRTLVKQIESSPYNRQYIVEQRIDDYFYTNQVFSHKGCQVYCCVKTKLGFKVGKEYFNYDYKSPPNCPGCLVYSGRDSIDTDSGYQFNYLKVIAFCKKNNISLKIMNSNDKRISKIKYEANFKKSTNKSYYGNQYKERYIGRPCWYIGSLNNNYSGIDQYYILDGKSGKILAHREINQIGKPCKHRRGKSPYKNLKPIEPVSPTFENIDTSYLMNLKRERKIGMHPTADLNDTMVKYVELKNGNIYEYGLEKNLIKTIILKKSRIEIENYLDSFFTDYKQYFLNGYIESKKIESIFGFRITNSYKYNMEGGLNSVKNNDSGYLFDYLQVFNFCYRNCIPLSRKQYEEAGPTINKMRYEQFDNTSSSYSYGGKFNPQWIGKPCWIIVAHTPNARRLHIYILDGADGKVLHDYIHR